MGQSGDSILPLLAWSCTCQGTEPPGLTVCQRKKDKNLLAILSLICHLFQCWAGCLVLLQSPVEPCLQLHNREQTRTYSGIGNAVLIPKYSRIKELL